MPKKAVSLTLDEANILWLKGQGHGQGNLSAAVDDLITAARTRLGVAAAARSVVGTIDIAADDPRLDHADHAIREVFAASLARPFRVAETRAPYEPVEPRKRARRRRG